MYVHMEIGIVNKLIYTHDKKDNADTQWEHTDTYTYRERQCDMAIQDI